MHARSEIPHVLAAVETGSTEPPASDNRDQKDPTS